MASSLAGPYELHALLGIGGMGQVWRATLTGTGGAAAVKLLTGERSTRDDFRRRLYDEVRATARLDHPNIVVIRDAGELAADLLLPNGDSAPAGSPWVALELATGGELGRLLRKGEGPARWSQVRRLLKHALAGLAHAHARGLAHLDVKPGNLLAFPAESDRTWKLADFGLAQAVRERRSSSVREAPTGSPHYMAPEQVRGAWRDYGPWTDLYGLACVAWELTTGAPPFVDDLPRAHLGMHLPTFRPTLSVPDGFDAWLGRCLRKRPLDRFQRAADARYALDQLGEPDDTGEIPLPAVSSGRSSETWFGSISPSGALPLPDLPTAHGDETFPACEVAIPPLHTTAPTDERGTLLALGVGIGLFGLRQVPLVGREAEREALWTALTLAARTGRARLALVHGAPGVGASHLARWLAERAHELGAAHVFRAVHDERPGPEHGLGPMVARHHGTTGLPDRDARRRLAQRLRDAGVDEHAEWTGLAALAHPEPDQTALTEANAHGLVLRMIERACLADGRPAIVWLDGVQWGPSSLGFARFVLASRNAWPVPLLLVLTVRDEALATRPDEARWIDDLRELDPEALDMPLGPLALGDRVRLIREILNLEAPLAARVEERTAGHPLFAVQLVGDWVRRGLLEPGPDGYRLTSAEHELPDALGAIYADEVRRIADEVGDEAIHTLEVAAALGIDLHTDEWRAACVRAGLAEERPALDALLARGLATARNAERGWSFAHGLVRSTFEDRARRGGRWTRWNQAVAAALEGQRDVARRARLALNAGSATAVEALLDAVEERIYGGRIREGLSLLSLAREAAAARSEDDPVRGRLALVAASAWRFHGDLPEARRQLEAARILVEDRGWTDLRVEWQYAEAELARASGTARVEAIEAVIATLRDEGQETRRLQAELARVGHLQLAGRLEDALEAATRVEQEAPPGSLEGLQALYWRGQTLLSLGALDRAEAPLRQAFERLDRRGQLQGAANALFDLAMIEGVRGDLDASERSIRAAQERHQLTGSPQGLADCLNNLGEVLRARGAYEEADTHYRQALGLYEIFGGDRLTTRLNIAQTLIARERWLDARVQASQALAEAVESGSVLWQGACHALLCPTVAEDAALLRNHLAAARSALEETGFAYPDIAAALELAADRAREAGHRSEAEAAGDLAADQYRRLGDADAVQRLT